MAEQFGTSRFPIPKDMEAPYMRVVELPQCEKYVPTDITVSALYWFSINEVRTCICMFFFGRPIKLHC